MTEFTRRQKEAIRRIHARYAALKNVKPLKSLLPKLPTPAGPEKAPEERTDEK